jgi:hypothetical protein
MADLPDFKVLGFDILSAKFRDTIHFSGWFTIGKRMEK